MKKLITTLLIILLNCQRANAGLTKNLLWGAGGAAIGYQLGKSKENDKTSYQNQVIATKDLEERANLDRSTAKALALCKIEYKQLTGNKLPNECLGLPSSQLGCCEGNLEFVKSKLKKSK